MRYLHIYLNLILIIFTQINFIAINPSLYGSLKGTKLILRD